jgi:hypothetical protein
MRDKQGYTRNTYVQRDMQCCFSTTIVSLTRPVLRYAYVACLVHAEDSQVLGAKFI